jgi:hypothetical protein
MKKLTTVELGQLFAQGLTGVQKELNVIKTDVSSIKDDVAAIKSMLINHNPINAEVAGALACPHCGKALSKGEVEFCRKNNIEPSCYACRNPKRTNTQKPHRITQEEATTKIKYVGRCKHEFHYTRPTYQKYVNRCRELGVPVLLCPQCAKQFLDNKTVQPQAENEANQGF